MNSEKLLIYLDASALGESSCMHRLFNNVIMGWTAAKQNNDMEFGSAVHKFRKVFRDKGYAGWVDGLEEARTYYSNKPMFIRKDYLTEEFLAKVCFAYANTYRNDSFETLRSHSGEVLTELRFNFPYYIDDQIEILFAGTMDELGKFNHGAYGNGDLKVTSLWDKRKFFEGYRLSSQLRFYRWALREYAFRYPDSIFAEVEASGNVISFIDGVFHKPGTKGNMAEVEFARSENPIIFSKEELDEFGWMLQEKVHRFVELVHAWLRDGTLPIRDGILVRACQTVYGECKYSKVCPLPDQTSREMELENSFVKRSYDPMTHGD